MKFLSLYTASATPGGMPSQEHMAAMGALMEKWMKSGALKETGGLMNRSTAMKATLKDGAFTVEDGEIVGHSLMPASGFAVLEFATREDLAAGLKEFMEVAGDGKSEVIQIFEMDDH
jgi:hypothetical protein